MALGADKPRGGEELRGTKAASWDTGNLTVQKDTGLASREELDTNTRSGCGGHQ